MKGKTILSIVATLLCSASAGAGHCDSGPSYRDTVQLIKDTMLSGTSAARNESYHYVSFDGCLMEYKVSGTYPVGTPYTIKFSGMDFSTLDSEHSRTGHDYTAFLRLKFNKPALYQPEFSRLEIGTVVVNVSDDAKTGILFQAFRHLGELCGAPGGVSSR